ncbi:hypothetical protein LCGC14_0467750 [marine sediment metagenome]|uniref:Ice-binding protein C-terminal domain-containing protein n=1 Tax=marine sediment metagenome TaxID=412755 RepID=A0A0F9SDA3_9ZZZZ|nr:PEP-CTERM sorting domain-containing protein [Phycisphaerae bacterium]HDZ43507.1 PEP-CTERM sorting domain-containing protein [Phycisphaerae bacterium]
MRRQKTHTSARLAAYAVAAGATVLSTASTANAALKVYDHRAAPLYPIVDYGTWDQTLMLMNVQTGDFQYVVVSNDWDPASVSRYDQDGFVDNNWIPEVDKTDDTVWFSHRDVDIDIGAGGGSKPGESVTLETPTGGAGGVLSGSRAGPVYAPGRGSGTEVAHDWYWAEQVYDDDNDPLTPDASEALPLPVDGAAWMQVDSSLSFNDSSPTGYTGVVSHGMGGLGHGSGTEWGYRWFSIGFKLEQADGTHYGWVALDPGIDLDRNRIRSVFGWGYQTTPYMAAELTWIGDSDGVEGDYDGDGDVDAADIKILCENMAGDPALYDADGDGDVDEADMIYHIENLVEWDNGVDNGVGTKRGDFNLDGLVNGTDLALMKTAFGQPLMDYADGNANCDAFVNGTDLAILKTNFGFIALPSPAVPEPATLSVLALGAAGIASRRRRKQ